MSTLNVSNITDGTDTVDTSYVLNGSAKAWILHNQSSTQFIRDSFNVSSISDTGTGRTEITFTSAMGNVNYSVSGSIENGAGFNDSRMINRENSQPRSATVFGMYTVNGGSSTVNPYADDVAHANVQIHGDLA